MILKMTLIIYHSCAHLVAKLLHENKEWLKLLLNEKIFQILAILTNRCIGSCHVYYILIKISKSHIILKYLMSKYIWRKTTLPHKFD